MLGDYAYVNIRSAAILTNAYVAGTVIGPQTAGLYGGSVQHYNQLILYVAFTIGSLTDAQIKVEFSHDGVTYYQESFSSVSAGVDTVTTGVHKLAATGNYRIAIPIKDGWIKVSSIGTGTVTSSSLGINATLGTV